MNRPFRTALFLLLLPLFTSAHEGMWLPTVLGSIQDRMQAEGLKLTAEDIYSVNNGSLKDAIVLFGGGCTAEVISAEGLILTNHHCGFGAIQEHSTVERDLLKNGFWAMDRSQELRNAGLTATFIIRMEDVTDRMLQAVPAGADEAARQQALGARGQELAREATTGSHHQAVVRAFNYGLQYILIVSEVFRDVRLVGAPPGAIGNFGGDTDNWMWPRHTGDFSVFRIYADADGRPADPAPTNVPFKPRHVLPISMQGVKEGDFAMIFGFPGNTQRYLHSSAVAYITTVGDPLRIRMRRASLAVIDGAMLASDRTRIAYADKQKGISNAYKKWIGELRGLEELRTVDRKRELEATYAARARAAGRSDLLAVLDSLERCYAGFTALAKARDLHVEFFLVGAELFRFAQSFHQLADAGGRAALEKEGKLKQEMERLRARAAAFHKDFDPAVDQRVLLAQYPIYREHLDPVLGPDLSDLDTRFKDARAWAEHVYTRSLFADASALDAILASGNAKALRRLDKDPALAFARRLSEAYATRVKPAFDALGQRIQVHMRGYVGGLITLFPEKEHWPDANSTLRLSYGKVEGSRPRDGMTYEPFTHLGGVMEKYRPGDAEFEVPARLRELYAAHDFGAYGNTDGTMPVCFTSSLHTTGGNSGSPVLNGRGELIGINFDRSWESTMSDIQFDPAKCRNISTDIRYVLFVIDKVCGAGHLVQEMQLAYPPKAPGFLIDLPIHR
ncbi:MAG: S46 family peptidase [Flavobacteriales bacterium]|nr:Asp/Glu-specific dipeptidyl-peptidase [Flavobacteriales bacterium]MCC6578377.1 S46 family peptidase [Flavobacteriales bacterium]NUQ15221.1 S46 family peptidase [Flavobacteriales bacterium]